MKQATLYQLKVFEAAARHGSFSRAAEELFVSQPTVSMQVKQLSKSVGLPLFQQVGKRMHLTDAGKQLLGTCQEIFETISQFETKMTDFKLLKQGELRLAATTTAKYLLPRTFGTFCQLYPGIDVRLQLINHKAMTDRMLVNLDDLYIMNQVPDNIDVITQPFLEDPLVVVASANHPFAGEKNLSLQQIIDESGFILREPGSETRRVVQKFLEEQQIKIKGKLEFGSNEAIKHAIAGGLGVSILSKHTLMSEPAVPGLTILDVEHLPLKRNWYIVYPTGKHLSITARTYLNYLLETHTVVKPFVESLKDIEMLVSDFSLDSSLDSNLDKNAWSEFAVSNY